MIRFTPTAGFDLCPRPDQRYILTDENWLNNIAISEAIKKLGERERRILLLRFYNGKTQTEFPRKSHFTAQVSRLEKHALEKKKKQM
jgi:RNA polymerase sporulation-specific sigma factor